MAQRPENESPQRRDARIAELGRAYAAALLSGDEISAEIAIREAMDAGLRSAEIDDEIIAPALWLVGDLGERGEISIADEHLATEISIRVLALQREAHRLTRTRGAHRVMLAAPPGELHVVALGMAADLLREAGYEILMLGADVPVSGIIAAAARHRPAVICLTSTMRTGEERLTEVIDALQGPASAPGFVLGGRGLTGVFHAHPGIEVCRRVSEAVEAADALVKRSSLN